MSRFEDTEGFDCLYSVSVIAHMPAAVRRQVLQRMADIARPGARLLLSVDLVPGTLDLWPLSEGKQVDPDAPHGTLDTLRGELEVVGALVEVESLLRDVEGSRTDVALIGRVWQGLIASIIPRRHVEYFW